MAYNVLYIVKKSIDIFSTVGYNRGIISKGESMKAIYVSDEAYAILKDISEKDFRTLKGTVELILAYYLRAHAGREEEI